MGGIDWAEILKQGGYFFLLVVGLYGFYRFIQYAKTKIAEPIVAAHLELLGKLKETLPKQEQLLEGISTVQKYQTASLEQHRLELTEKLGDLLDANVQQTDLLRKIEGHQKNGHGLEHKSSHKLTDQELKAVEQMAEEEKRKRNNKRGAS